MTAALGCTASPALPVVGAPRLRLTARGRRLLRTLAVLAAVVVGSVCFAVAAVAGAFDSSAAASAAPAALDEVVVEEGDSLWTIAVEHGGGADSAALVDEIVALNGLSAKVVHPGQVLEVPAR